MGQPAAALREAGVTVSRNVLAAALLTELAGGAWPVCRRRLCPIPGRMATLARPQDEPVVVAPMQGEGWPAWPWASTRKVRCAC